MEPPLTLQWLPGRYAVCRLDAAAQLPTWLADPLMAGGATPGGARLLCVSRTDSELSIVCDESLLPPQDHPDMKIERNFAALRVVGTLGFSLTGIIARLSAPLAQAGIPVFVLSTFETDYLLVRSEHKERAAAALKSVASFQNDSH